MCGIASICQNNMKTCCECGRPIRKGELCWRIQNPSPAEGSRHICEACMTHLSHADEYDFKMSRIESGHAEHHGKCMRCKDKLRAGDRIGMIRVRPYHTVINRGVVKSTARKSRVCVPCLKEMQEEIKVFRRGMYQEDAVKHLTGNSEFLRERAKEILNGKS